MDEESKHPGVSLRVNSDTRLALEHEPPKCMHCGQYGEIQWITTCTCPDSLMPELFALLKKYNARIEVWRDEKLHVQIGDLEIYNDWDLEARQ